MKEIIKSLENKVKILEKPFQDNLIITENVKIELKDKDGKIINEPSPFLNHLMDAGRYGMESLRTIDQEDLILFGEDYRNINEGLNKKWSM